MGGGFHGGMTEGFGGGFGPGGGMSDMMPGGGPGGMMGGGMGGDGPPDDDFGSHRRLPPDMDRSATRCSPPPPRPREGQRQGGTPPTNVHEDVDVSKIQIGGSD
ncbi:hypothetical protein DY926_00540 [Komagataeibacter melaceti]|uniref:Uncharacterized protein n=1 Tax=Komagataeibacter melaceti TaxID=2766577 RepID=A0A371Z4Q7_9PROT|nr:hypothetical protein DY926_00540 [Komagataeibacter melaceti]